MGSIDLVLLHPPSVMDFRRRTQLSGPVSDLIPSTPVFEMYPIGFTTMASHLESKGYEVRIANLATRMLASPRFNPERFIRSLDAKAFGIDLHWMPHVQGAFEVAKMVKRHHEGVPVMMGGFSSSFYHREIIDGHPEVDFVLRGDSTEVPLGMLMERISRGASPKDVPNLTWRDVGRTVVNPLTHVPETLDDIEIDYGLMVRKVLRYRDLDGHLPYKNWKSNPMSIAVGVRGCTHNCVNCAGSCDSFARNFGRERPAYRSPEKLAEDVSRAEEYVKGATFVVGDIRQPGKQHATRFLDELKRRKVRNEVVLELFTPADTAFAAQVKAGTERFSIQMSPETHDDSVRRAQGKPYTAAAMEKTAEHFLDAGCGRFDLFYMIGLPTQTSESVQQTVEYTRGLYQRFKGKRLFPFISPLAPFIDPGGNAFDDPKRHGYRILARGLDDHIALASMPSWKHVLNYETEWMTRDDIAEATYSAGLGLNSVKREMGLVTGDVAEATERRIVAAREMMHTMDRVLDKGVPSGKDLDELREAAAALNESTVCDKEELDWSESSVYASIPRMISSLLRGR
ncbi:MAG: TIGR04190 family B12-binding domain/radical SAM domain protein [Thermoplasmata archaeon]|nr:TIGR04190 family B12-binding domain/radical SAM domain protein [Thermoplasmata archaeon]